MTYKIKKSKQKAEKESYAFRSKNYKNFADLEKDIKKNGTKDYYKVNGVIYTQEEYDFEGKRVLYANKRTNTGFIINTEDRYKKGFADAKLEYSESWDFFRNDINYID